MNSNLDRKTSHAGSWRSFRSQTWRPFLTGWRVLPNHSYPLSRLNKRIVGYAIVGSLIYIIGVAIYSYVTYQRTVAEELKSIDHRLAIGAMAAFDILGEQFFLRARDVHSIGDQEDRDNIRRLSEYNDTAQLAFIYAAVLVGDRIYLTASSATASELEQHTELHYFHAYDSASEAMYQAFRTQATQYYDYTDQWGAFRGTFVPRRLSDGRILVLAAEIRLDYLKHLRRRLERRQVFEAVLFLVLALPLFATIVRALIHSNFELWQQGRTDRLTRLPNRDGFVDALEGKLDAVEQTGRPLGLLFLDLDGFKEVNDSFGHPVGDVVLIEIARLLHQAIADRGALFRVGGDEFCILAEGGEAQCNPLARALVEALKPPIQIGDYCFFLSCSIGIRLFPQDC